MASSYDESNKHKDNAMTSNPFTNQFGIFGALHVVLLFVVLSIIGVSGYVVYQKQAEKSVTTTAEETGGKNGVSITSTTTKTEDCGSQDCFDAKFTACQPATLSSVVGGTTLEDSFVGAKYTIIGPSDGQCKMTYVYTKNPNPDWTNKEMTCLWNNSLSFDDAIQATFDDIDASKCTGPLVAVLKDV